MDLKLTEHVENIIFLLNKQKNCVKFRYLELSDRKNQFWPIFRWKSTFSDWPCFITSLWRHTLTDFHDFGINGKRRPYPILWYQTTILCACQFQIQRVVTTHVKTCYKKGSGRRRLSYASKQSKYGFHQFLGQFTLWCVYNLFQKSVDISR